MLKKKSSRGFCLAVLLLAIIAALMFTHRAVGDEPALVVELARGANKSQVKTEDNGIVIVAYSSSGIGELKVKNGSAPWPMTLKLRLKYDETRGFRHLEAFTLSDAKSRLQSSLGREEVEVDFVDGAAPRDAAKPEMKVVKTNDAIEILLPMAWLADSDEFTLHWIDLFRH